MGLSIRATAAISFLGCLTILGATGCIPNLSADPDSVISCETSADCPGDFECDGEFCRPLGPPRVSSLEREVADGRPLAQQSFNYRVTDSEGDLMSVAAQWSLDGESWNDATAGGPQATEGLSSIGAGDDPYTFVWDMVADLPAQSGATEADGTALTNIVAATNVQFRLTPSDDEFVGRGMSTPPFSVGNDAPTVEMLSALGDRNDISMELRVTDTSSDASDIEVQFRMRDVVVSPPELSTLGGWRRAAIGLGDVSALSTAASGTEYVFVWSSDTTFDNDTDIPQGMQGITALTVELRARAVNQVDATTRHYGGWSDPITVGEVNNQTPPQISDVEVPRPQLAGGSGPVTISYLLTDEQSDIVDVDVEYSLDFGQSWLRAEEYRLAISEGRYDLATAPARSDGEGGLRHRFVWDATNIALSTPSGTQLRLTAADGAAQSSLVVDLARSIGPTGSDAFADPLRVHFGGLWGSALIDINGDGLDDPLAAGSPARVAMWISNEAGFQEVADLPSGDGAGAMVTGDYNGDGDEDFVVLNFFSNSFDVFLGDTVGSTFSNQPPDTVGVCDGPTVGAADFLDGDANLDLVVLCSRDTTYQAWLGDGLGGFSLAGTGPTTGAPFAVATGFFTNDAVVDIAIGADVVTVVEGLNTGFFMAPATILAEARGALAVVELDAIPDGLDDLAAGDFLANDVVLLQNNAGVFSTPFLPIPVSGAPVDMIALDLEGDGLSEVAVLGAFTNTVTLLDADPNGGLRTRQNITATGSLVRTLASGDINGDGFPDLIAAHLVGADLSVFLQEPDTHRLEPPQALSSFNPGGVVTMDFDGDGILDLAVSRQVSFDVQVRLGLDAGGGVWSGEFGPAVSYDVGISARNIVGADFTGNDEIDLVVGASDGPNIALLTGVGNGTFATARTFQVGSETAALLAADINADNRPDLVSSNTSSESASVLLATGTGGVFAPEISVSTGSAPLGLDVADWNDDGDLDLMIVSRNDRVVWLATGNGDGTFTSFVASYGTGSRLRDVRAGDFNADGILDMAASSEDAFGVWVFIGNGSGDPTDLFESPRRFGTGGQASNMAVADLNVDGVDDIILAQRFDSQLHVLVGGRVGGEGTGDFGTPTIFAEPLFPTAADPADFNNDGLPDLVTVNRSSGTVSIRLASPPQTLETSFSEVRTLPAGAASPVQSAVADLDNDGALDLVSANVGNSLSYFYGSGDAGAATGFFEDPDVVTLGGQGENVGVADFDGDGALDIAVGVGGSDIIGIFLRDQPGSRAVVAANDVPSGGVDIWGLAVADFSQDNVPDLVSLHITSGDLALHTGNGDGTFTAAGLATGLTEPTQMTVHDFDLDGDPDIIVSSDNDTWLVAVGASGLGAPSSLALGPSTAAAAGDFDRDGLPDLALTSSSGELITRRGLGDVSGDGAPEFDTPQRTFTGYQLDGVAVADFDGDGALDLVVSDEGTNRLIALRGAGDGTFPQINTFATGSGINSVTTADLNHDSLPDILTTNFFAGDLGQHFGQLGSARERRWTVPVLATQTPAPSVHSLGPVATLPGADRTGHAYLPAVLGLHIARVVPGTTVVDIREDLNASGLPATDILAPISAPWLITGMTRLTRVAGEDALGGARLRVEERYGDLIEADPRIANRVPGLGYSRTGLDLAGTPNRSGILARVPLHSSPTGTIRVFLRTRDWVRADAVTLDPLSTDAEAHRYLPRVDVDGGYRDLLIETSSWQELPEDIDLANATTPSWTIAGQTLEVATDRAGIIQAYRVVP